MAFKEYEFTDWDVAREVQDALNAIDEAIASAHVLLNQIRRKQLECWQGERLLLEEIPAAARQFGELGEALEEEP